MCIAFIWPYKGVKQKDRYERDEKRMEPTKNSGG